MTDPLKTWAAQCDDNRVRVVIAEAMGNPQKMLAMFFYGKLVEYTSEPPDYFGDPSASAALLDWLAGKECSIERSILDDATCILTPAGHSRPHMGVAPGKNSDGERRALALAACKAIEAGAVKEKP